MSDAITSLEQLKAGTFYKVGVLQSILKEMGFSYSIFTIRDYETWKCLNYKCGKRNAEKVDVCPKCGGEVRPAIIPSPRTLGGGKGFGHRRYSGEDIQKIIEVFGPRA
jgi:hypothetical protein